ncbi:Crp/Fnr family transcriptional regulator [Paractinoplanes brasiliensis]|uniref:CRP-like cAMP-binding protein n=1 Tax=Paractinoplanes brasiliensis TaxID=52695 RepID=A0A4R6JBB1_9ACTN|nr:Crp/Fnr family transcriptional regulator [Actinoplanes brasiliensis]TDO32211.1 CRP-like cAMP-binding protein [Actinoplanes brasiliensis]GID28264.1 Crp/Fnr family transcriptional regulator [Actinoplanes brasiliensis]
MNTDVDPGEFVAELAPADRDDLFRIGQRRRWPAGATLFSEGDRSTTVVLVISGRAKVFSLTAQGGEVLLAIRGPGALLGEMSALDGAPRSASVSALEPLEAYVVTVAAFLDFLGAHPDAAVRIVRMIVSRLRDADRKRVEFGAYDALGRVALRLAELAERFGDSQADAVRITLPLTQDELAAWTGSSRESVTKALGTLRRQGIIETSRRSVSVIDLDRLRARAK